MKVYFAGAIRGGREFQSVYAEFVYHIIDTGHEVLSEHVASSAVFKEESGLSNEQIYSRDIDMLNECDVMVAEVSVPSLGVGYEISYMLHGSPPKPVLCLCHAGVKLSAMIAGNTQSDLDIFFYAVPATAIKRIDLFLNKSTL